MQRQTARQRQLPFLPRGATPNLPTRPLVLLYKKPLLARPNSVDVNLTGVRCCRLRRLLTQAISDWPLNRELQRLQWLD
jgi:hypothetical protein